MHAHEHVLGARDVALHERDVVLAGQRLAEGDGREVAVRGRHRHGGRALDELLVPPSIFDQVGNGDQLQPVALAIRNQVRDAGHRSVLVHDLADDACWNQAGEPREVDRRFGLACAGEHAAFGSTAT